MLAMGALYEPWAQAQTAGLSTRGRLEVVSGAGHNVMIDRPDAVVQAIRDVVEAARTH
ncbi:MAG TPA: hypothetical protein VK464_16445 [Symbiobacteriaceae bacterium]|nr:hypothetical protein [Symbiobacteriaceae bacterium]